LYCQIFFLLRNYVKKEIIKIKTDWSKEFWILRQVSLSRKNDEFPSWNLTSAPIKKQVKGHFSKLRQKQHEVCLNENLSISNRNCKSFSSVQLVQALEEALEQGWAILFWFAGRIKYFWSLRVTLYKQTTLDNYILKAIWMLSVQTLLRGPDNKLWRAVLCPHALKSKSLVLNLFKVCFVSICGTSKTIF